MGTDAEEIERLAKQYNTDWFSCESPRHQVTVSSFLFGKYPITQAQWEAVMGERLSPFKGANYNGNSDEQKEQYRQGTTEVGSFPPNPFGLSDLHGNLFEWCLDDWHENYHNAPTDGGAWLDNKSDGLKLLRGGAWQNSSSFCRSAFRDYYVGGNCYSLIGFRVVALVPETV